MIRTLVSGERLFRLALCSLSLIAATGRNVAQTAQRTDADVQHFVDSLLQKMTTEEKIGQLSQLFVFDSSDPVEKPVARGEVGSLLFITDPAMINRLQHIAVEKSRLHIPLIFGYDVIHGFRTIFPVPIAMAASWDPSLETEGQANCGQRSSVRRNQLGVCTDVGHCTRPSLGSNGRGCGEKISLPRIRHGRRPGPRISG